MMFSDSVTSEAALGERYEHDVNHIEPPLGPIGEFNHDNRSIRPAISRRSVKRAYKRRVVCKARGLSKKHNADTAYFEIQANAPHGLLLSSSHPE